MDRPTARLSFAERLNFLITNRVPRRWATIAMGRFSRIESRWLTRLSIRIWQAFVDDLRLEEAEERSFTSLRDCFTRRLRPGARPVDPRPYVLTSPCDAVIGEFGRIDERSQLIQAKGFPYALDELVADEAIADRYRGGLFVTLRLKSSMYHRFHAPLEGRLDEARYISGDAWNVNPVTLKVVERLFCRNERAVLEIQPALPDLKLALVPVAAILVGGIRLHCLPEVLDLRYRGANRLPCDTEFEKGDELGYFQHGSTIVLLAEGHVDLVGTLKKGEIIRAGQPLLIHRDPANRN